jgi:hypothetical protein
MVDLLGIIREATKKVPALRYALGVAALAAVVALVKTFQINFRAAVWGTIILLFLMVILVVFAKLAASQSSVFVGPVKVLMWTCVIAFVSTTALLFSSVFFGVPQDLKSWLKGSDSKTEIIAPLNLDSSIAKNLKTELFELQGEAIDYFMDSQSVKTMWLNLNEVSPIVVRSVTSIMDTLDYLKQHYNYHPLTEDQNIIMDGIYHPQQNADVYFKHHKANDLNVPSFNTLLAGTNPNMSPEFIFSMRYGNVFDEFGFTKDSLTENPGPHVAPTTFMTLKALEGIDTAKYWFGRFNNSLPYLQLYAYIFRTHLPREMINLELLEHQGCSGEEIDIKFTTPIIKLGILAVTNLNTFPVEITSASLRKTNSDSVRSFTSDDKRAYAEIKRNIRAYLDPKQSFLIPVYISLLPLNEFKDRKELINPKEWTTPKKGLVYGDRFYVDTLFINNAIFTTAPEESTSICASNGITWIPAVGGASCPSLFQFINESFKPVGTLIPGNDSKRKNWSDTLKLDHFSNEFELRELEDETSYIDQVSLLYQDTVTNSRFIFSSTNSLLKQNDGRYLQTTKGEKVDLRFDIPKGKLLNKGRIFVVSKGYYVPTPQAKSKPSSSK